MSFEDGSMEPFVFAGNRRRWRYVRPFLGAATLATGVWFAALCWVLLKTPALPDLDLKIARPAGGTPAATRLARGLEHGASWSPR
jgi:hypothetical protein